MKLPLGSLAPALAAVAVVVASGLVQGRLTGRWVRSLAIPEAVERIGRVPMTIGDWEGHAETLEEGMADRAELAGYIVRHYTHRRTGASVQVLLVCGRPGPISVHTPDVCYASAGYEPTGDLSRVTVAAAPPGPPAVFQAGLFAKPASIVPSYLRILWAWDDGKGWRAPDNPRLQFAPAPVLYKLYLVSETTSMSPAAEGDPDSVFARELLPVLRRTLEETR